jgi:hypothetical protein
MRLPLLRALYALPAALAVVGVGAGAIASGACGGPSFAGEAPDAGALPPTPTPDAGGFCAQDAGAHKFCDDFDGPPLTSKWDSVDQGAGGTAVTDSTVSDSPPASFESIAPASVATETRGRLVKSFGTASRVVVGFELAIDATPVKLASGVVGGDSLLGIYAGASYAIGLRAHADAIGYFEDLTGDGGAAQVLTTKDLVATPTLHGWTPVVMTIDLAHANLSIAIGGVTLLDEAPITPPSGESITVYLGALSRNEAQSLAAHYDNVTIDLTP